MRLQLYVLLCATSFIPVAPLGAGVMVEMSASFDREIYQNGAFVWTIRNTVSCKITYDETIHAPHSIVNYQASLNGEPLEDKTIGPTFSGFQDVVSISNNDEFSNRDSFNSRQTFANPGDTGDRFSDKGIQYLAWQLSGPPTLFDSEEITELIGLSMTDWTDPYPTSIIMIDGQETTMSLTSFSASHVALPPPMPTIMFSNGQNGEFVIEFTGVLQSSDRLGVWADIIPQPTSPYVVINPSGKMFYRAKNP